jgi:hypothetical protein
MQAAELLRLFPEVIQRTHGDRTPLAGVLKAMASLPDPADRRLKQLDAYFDPYRAPDAMIPYLAAWVDLAGFPVRKRDEQRGLTIERLRA